MTPDPNKSELKPCPFCCDDAEEITTDLGGSQVRCVSCWASSAIFHPAELTANPRESALNAWNSRASERDAEVPTRHYDLELKLTKAEQQLAAVTADRDSKQKSIEAACRDWSDDDTRVKEIAAKFGIRDDDTPGYFQGVIEIAEKMAARLSSAESARDALAKELAALKGAE